MPVQTYKVLAGFLTKTTQSLNKKIMWWEYNDISINTSSSESEDCLVREAGLSVNARVKEAVFSSRFLLWTHFLPPTCCFKYLSSPNDLWHSKQVNCRDIVTLASKPTPEHFSLCFVKP